MEAAKLSPPLKCHLMCFGGADVGILTNREIYYKGEEGNIKLVNLRSWQNGNLRGQHLSDVKLL